MFIILNSFKKKRKFIALLFKYENTRLRITKIELILNTLEKKENNIIFKIIGIILDVINSPMKMNEIILFFNIFRNLFSKNSENNGKLYIHFQNVIISV